MRVRPTREETRARLFEAAAEVFAEQGVSAATIEQICSAAGFSRGAFYSNFETKDELLLAMLDDHVSRSIVHNRRLLEQHPDTAGFVGALARDTGRDADPLHNSPLLQIELILRVARNPEQRHALVERLQTMRQLIGEIVSSTLSSVGVELDIDPVFAGSIILALEDGFRLHRLIDPSTTSADAFVQAIQALQRLAVRSA
jgi:AcrR family transcriptional regulator